MVKIPIIFKISAITLVMLFFMAQDVCAINENFGYAEEKIITDSSVAIYEDIDLEFTDINKFNIMGSNFNPLVMKKSLKRKFSLNEEMKLDVENQKDTKECWAFSILNSMETNLFIKNNAHVDFSERHMDYATSNSLYGENVEVKYDRPVRIGGTTEMGLAYLTNGQGAVLEDEMKFENNMNVVSSSITNIKPSYYTKDYVKFPNIIKIYDLEGNITYYNSYGTEFTKSDICNIRNQIKQYICENGALVSVMPSNYVSGYNNLDDITKSTAFCCKDAKQKENHAVTIVGWDDDYDRLNFSEANRPKNNGAYLVLQSYGEHFFDGGYIYISYEDAFIESALYGICNSGTCDYDNLYQNDYYGANGTMKLKNSSIGYISTYFTRDKIESEILTKVSVNIPQSASIEVWVNPNGIELAEDNLIKVSDRSAVLTPGYHTIDVKNVKLTGEKFAVVIKQISEKNDFYFNVEYCNLDTLFYKYVSSESGRNKISIDGKNWETLDEQGENTKSEFDLNTADLCIKAFTCKDTDDNKI